MSAEAIAKEIVDAALAVEFGKNAILKSPMSRVYSLMQSVMTRHGAAIQTMLADGLSQNEDFEVFRDHPMPVGVTALELVSSRTDPEILKRTTLSSSGAMHHVSIIDLLTIHLRRGWAGVFDCKRGQSAISGARRRALELDLRAMRLTLPSYARGMGFLEIDYATSAVIDYLGNAGFREEMTLSGPDIDRLFETPLTAKINRMTVALEHELHATLLNLLRLDADGSMPPEEIEQVSAEVVDLFRARTARPLRPGKTKKPDGSGA